MTFRRIVIKTHYYFNVYITLIVCEHYIDRSINVFHSKLLLKKFTKFELNNS